MSSVLANIYTTLKACPDRERHRSPRYVSSKGSGMAILEVYGVGGIRNFLLGDLN